MKSFDEIATDLEALLGDMTEEITLEDLQHHEGLRRIIVAADDITNRVRYRALEWAKSQ
jgi:hypothetical protein